jgi:DNA repair protein RecO (recombination protein O)
MLHKTRGIVLRTTNFSESSVVAKIYTELFGLQSYLINGVRNKKAKVKANLLQPLTLLNLVVYHKERGGLQRISEIRADVPFASIPYRIVKSSVVLFLNEILNQAILEEEVNPDLFHFIYNSVCILDLLDEDDGGCANFHMAFLMQLSKFLGFFPLGQYSEGREVFNLKEGLFQKILPNHPNYLSNPLSKTLYQLATFPYTEINRIFLSKSERKELLQKILLYYQLHISGFSNIKAHLILEEVMQ